MRLALMDSIRAVYLVAPILGANLAAVASTAIALRSLGLTVYVASEQDPAADVLAAISRDLEAIENADAVVVLDGWETSGACRAEVTFAEGLGRPVLTAAEALRLDKAA